MALAQVALYVLMIISFIKELNYLEDGEDHQQHLMNQKILIKDLTLKFQE